MSEINQNQVITLKDLVEIVLSKDNMKAFMRVKDMPNDYPFNLGQLQSLIKEKGVTYGIKISTLEDFVQHPGKYMNEETLIAEGKNSINGQDAFIEYVFKATNERKFREKYDGTIDFFSGSNILNVEIGQLLAVKRPSTKGIAGTSVKGDSVRVKDGKDVRIKLGKNVVYKQETESIYATCAGQVSISNDGKINVFDVFEVKGDLDLKTGSIDFVGNVIIKGNVPSGFKVHARGDIMIGGSVEAAEILADGSITIAHGITTDNKGFVKAGKDIKTPFIVNSLVEAGGNIVVSQYIMNSTVKAGGYIECFEKKGIIVGGNVQAGQFLRTKIIGNHMNTPTSIAVGVKPSIINRFKEIQIELKELNDSIDKADKALHVLEQMEKRVGHLPPDKIKLKFQLKNTKLVSIKKIEEMKIETEEIEDELESINDSYIEALESIFSGTKIEIGKHHTFVHVDHKRTKYFVEENEIHYI